MKKEVKITIEKQGEEITISNSFGKKWTFDATDCAGLLCGMVASSCYEYFRDCKGISESFTMSLTVTHDGQ